MKVLFFAQVNEGKSSGVSKKIRGQASALGHLGEDVYLFLINSPEEISFYHYSSQNKALEKLWSKQMETAHGMISKYAMYLCFFKMLKEVIKEYEIKVVYFRKVTPLPCTIDFFKWLKFMRVVIFFEYPTYPYVQEWIRVKNYKATLLDVLFQRKLEKLIDHFFVISDEKTVMNLSFNKWTRLSNGIDVDSIEQRNAPKWERSMPLHCLALANVSFWHGFDRFIEGLNFYSQSNLINHQQVFLHIVGDGAEILSLKGLVEKHKISKYIIFHGVHLGEDLNSYFNQCHLGISSLGIHRKGLSSASELKVREYTARGLPFIIAHDDPDFPSDFEYMKKIPANDSPVSIESVLNFAERVLSEKEHPSIMRQYALDNLSWKKQMKVVKERLGNF